MEIKIFKKVPDVCKKYKYAILILLVGLVFMLFPGNKTKETSVEPQSAGTTVHIPLEERLAKILCQVEGAGKVEVVLTISAGEETLFQADVDSSFSEKDQSTRSDTVIITDSSHNETGLIKQVLPPVYQGAIIVCQGAERPSVRLEIVDAVSKLTGLGANSISVLKMK